LSSDPNDETKRRQIYAYKKGLRLRNRQVRKKGRKEEDGEKEIIKKHNLPEMTMLPGGYL
jgi:hypothetical protein